MRPQSVNTPFKLMTTFSTIIRILPSLRNVFIADYGNTKVRKVNSAGIITTIAASQSFGNPNGVSADTSGNVYIVDYLYSKVYMMNSAGTVSTFAGSGMFGSYGDLGPATSAALDFPYGVAVDNNNGYVYIADTLNNKIRVVQPVIPTCTTGSYLSGQVCQQCAAGTYNPTSGAQSSSACLACPQGTYNPTAGGVASSSCLSCPQGTYNPTTGGTSLASCLSCPQGTYGLITGGSSLLACLSCPSGTYNVNTGSVSSSACVSCGQGMFPLIMTLIPHRSPLFLILIYCFL